MAGNMSALLGSGDAVVLNLILQITVLGLAVLLFARCIRNNAAATVSVLYTGLISLLLLSMASLYLQSGQSSLLRLDLAASPLFDWDAIAEPYFGIPEISELTAIDQGVESKRAASSESSASRFSLTRFLASLLLLPLIPMLLLVWGGGLFFRGLGIHRSLRSIGGLMRLSRELMKHEEEFIGQSLADAIVLPQGLAVRVSSSIETPLLAGVLEPTILLPEDFSSRLTPNQLRAVMRHELAHFYRRDLSANLIQKIIVSIFWIHPLVHRIDKLLAQAREEVCDNYVISHESAIDYGETLLQLCSIDQHAGNPAKTFVSDPALQLGVVSTAWNVEQRIVGLLNQKRERIMRLTTRSKILLNVTVVSSALAISACQVGAQTSANSAGNPVEQVAQSASTNNTENEFENRTSDSGTLSPEVMGVITEVQALMQPADDREQDLEGAKQLLDSLAAERLEDMNDFEKATLYNFYTNYYLTKEDYPGAANVFETLLEIETLRTDIRQRTLRSLGQLHAALENWSESIRYYELWQAAASEKDDLVFRGLSYASYQLDDFVGAVPYWLDYMAVKREQGEELNREDYAYLNGLYFTLEDYEQALELTKEMILLFNTETDWNNLRAIHRELDVRENAESSVEAV